jgi:tetratricopeptide (TPR) repeat protein
MKKLILSLMVISLGLMAFSQPAKEKKMPVTSSSEKAKTLYNEAMLAYEDFKLAKFRDLENMALKEDPDFFMANYWFAIFYLSFNNENKFLEFANKAVNCKANLSKGELLLKDALAKKIENRKADLTEFGKKLVGLYPNDIYAYYNLLIFQFFINDYNAEISTIKNALPVAERPAVLYNSLGYAYMGLGQKAEAEAAFNKYIELAPNNPNAYDSKGDYYMNVKDYRKAYESYMKAHSIDSTVDYKKAMNAKAIADSLSKK